MTATPGAIFAGGHLPVGHSPLGYSPVGHSPVGHSPRLPHPRGNTGRYARDSEPNGRTYVVSFQRLDGVETDRPNVLLDLVDEDGQPVVDGAEQAEHVGQVCNTAQHWYNTTVSHASLVQHHSQSVVDAAEHVGQVWQHW